MRKIIIYVLLLILSASCKKNKDEIPHKRRVVFTFLTGSSEGKHNIFLTNLDGSEIEGQQTGRGYIVSDQTIDADFPHFSPDGNYIVYHTNPTNTGDIWLVNAATMEYKKLTGSEYHIVYRFPAFSSDSRTILFTKVYRPSGASSDQRELHSMDLNGRNDKLLISDLSSDFFAVTPDGTKMVYNKSGLYVANTDGSNPIHLPSQYGINTRDINFFSGDSKWVVVGDSLFSLDGIQKKSINTARAPGFFTCLNSDGSAYLESITYSGITLTELNALVYKTIKYTSGDNYGLSLFDPLDNTKIYYWSQMDNFSVIKNDGTDRKQLCQGAERFELDPVAR